MEFQQILAQKGEPKLMLNGVQDAIERQIIEIAKTLQNHCFSMFFRGPGPQDNDKNDGKNINKMMQR